MTPSRSFRRMLSFFDAHAIRPVIEREYAFAAVPEAFQHLARGAFGKVVVQVAN